ncbi:MAG: CPBP family intramembrane glutamate endopeptidase, partial [Balneolaceae bacterium]|nr:CPBP family intramembrane glutamate endopeptidase [Balneolaceae bacterium]
AALIFSGVHYIGVFGDPFTVGTFLFRFLFGLALNGIYIYRGFGMAAWTHAIYDMMVIAYM